MLFAGLLGRLVLATAVTAASAATINVNGTCHAGNCSVVPDLLFPDETFSASFDFVYTFANTDQYRLTGKVSAVNNVNAAPPIIQINSADVAITYLGNSTGTASMDDTLVIDFLQTFVTQGFGGTGMSGFEFISGTFAGAFAGATSVSGQGFSNGTAMALMGPFFPPDAFSASNSSQPFSSAARTTLDFRNTVVFGAGSQTGATISINNVPAVVQPVPEPATRLISGTGALLVFLRRRRILPARGR